MPLLLRYRAGDYNCLHQDLYGDLHFPFQVAVLLSEPEVDFDGGEFVLTEQRPRMQSRAHVVPLRMGDAVVFAVNEAPRAGTRGTYRVKMRHGVSEIRRGERFTLGIGQVIPGWDKGVVGMRVGGVRELLIPASLAYGARGAGDGVIPPNASLVFRIKLVDAKAP